MSTPDPRSPFRPRSGYVRSLLIAAFALALGCSKPQPPTVTPIQASLTRIDAKGVELRVELSAFNPNSVDLSATDINSRIALNKTQDLGTVQLPTSVTLPAGQATKVVAPVSINWTNVGTLALLAASGNPVPYSVDGTLDLGGALLHVGVPFHIEGSISREQLVDAVLHSPPALLR